MVVSDVAPYGLVIIVACQRLIKLKMRKNHIFITKKYGLDYQKEMWSSGGDLNNEYLMVGLGHVFFFFLLKI